MSRAAAVTDVAPCIVCGVATLASTEFCSTCRAKEIAAATSAALDAHAKLGDLLSCHPALGFLPDLSDFRAVLDGAIAWAAKHNATVTETGRDERHAVHTIKIRGRLVRFGSTRDTTLGQLYASVHVPEEIEGLDALAWFHGGAL